MMHQHYQQTSQHQGHHMPAQQKVQRGRTVQNSGDITLQVMHINQRIKIRVLEGESLALFYHKLCLYFEIADERNSSQIGLFERRGQNDYLFVRDRVDLRNDRLYYLYFRDKPDKTLLYTPLSASTSPQQVGGRPNTQYVGGHYDNEDPKKAKQFGWHNRQSGSGLLHMSGGNHKTIQGINLVQSQIEKVKRPKEEKKVLVCPFEQCLKEFSETGNLKTHMRTHTGERPFVCSQCDQQFITKGHLQAHELTHTGEKPFQCTHPGCSKRYSRAGRLKIHQRLHTGERPFICQVEGCEKAFREKGNLLTHMRIHNGQKPFRCDFADCDVSFTTQGHLTDHKRRHSGERPYVCETCNEKFMRSSTLKIHMRRHTGEKPYKCDKCERAFSESGNLRTHLKVHEEDGSSIGKRSRRNMGSSRQSSPAVSPASTSRSNKRTLKVVQKVKNNLPLQQKNLRPKRGQSNFQSREQAQEDEDEEEMLSPPPINLKLMPEVQLDFIQKQMSSDQLLSAYPSRPMSTLMVEEPMHDRRRKNSSSNLQQQQQQQIQPRTRVVPLSQQVNSQATNRQRQKVEQLAYDSMIKEEEIKLPIHEPAGPPGFPHIFSDNYGQYPGNNNQRNDFGSGLTPMYQNGLAAQGFGNGFENPFSIIQSNYQNQYQHQQQPQQSTSLGGLQSMIANSGNLGGQNPFSPTGMMNMGLNSAFSPKGFYANGNGGGLNNYMVGTPTNGETQYGLRSQHKRFGGNSIQGSAQPNFNFGQMGDSNKKFLSLGGANQSSSFIATSSFGQQNATGNSFLGNNRFSPTTQNIALDSPVVQGQNNLSNSHLMAHSIYGGFQKVAEHVGNQKSLANNNREGMSFAPYRGNQGGNSDTSPTSVPHRQQQQQQQFMQQQQQRRSIPQFISPRNNAQRTPQLTHHISFNQGASQMVQPGKGNSPSISDQARNAIMNNNNNSSKRNSSNSQSNRERIVKVEDPESFSHLASQFNVRNDNLGRDQQIVTQIGYSQNNSPHELQRANSTPRQTSNTGEYQASNFSALANVTAMQKNPVSAQLGMSELSAFRKSPRVVYNQEQQQPSRAQQGYSANNTPRVFGSVTTTASDTLNLKAQAGITSILSLSQKEPATLQMIPQSQQLRYLGAPGTGNMNLNSSQIQESTQGSHYPSQHGHHDVPHRAEGIVDVNAHKGAEFHQTFPNCNSTINSGMGSGNLTVAGPFKTGGALGSTPSPHNSNSMFDDLSSPKVIFNQHSQVQQQTQVRGDSVVVHHPSIEE